MRDRLDNLNEIDSNRDRPKIYYARAMDDLPQSLVEHDDENVQEALNKLGYSLINPYTKPNNSNLNYDTIVEDNLRLLASSHVLLANLSVPGYIYVGAVYEITQACHLQIPVVTYVGQTGLENRCYLLHYADFICEDLNESLEYIWRCLSKDGIKHQLAESISFYDVVGREGRETSNKPYKERQNDIERYETERNLLKKKFIEYCCDKDVLELGCGTGEWTAAMLKTARSLVSIDASENMLMRAKKRIGSCANKLTLLRGDFLKQHLTIRPLDVVVAYFTISFLPPVMQQQLLARIKDWLLPGGICLFAESAQFSTLPSFGLGRQRIQTRVGAEREYRIYKECFSPYQLKKVVSDAGFDVVELLDNRTWFSFCAARI
ncbi:MAG: class I SAM-dependent methyltransferase [Planctomycetota bacterium]|jgi:SAM-dependent methyltransferase